MRCVSDRPWVTAAETCEFVMALDAIGADRARALELFAWVQFLRARRRRLLDRHRTSTTSASTRDGELYPVEQPTWNSAAVVLAANALGGDGPTAGLFRGEGLPAGLTAEELIAAGATIEAERAAVAARATATATHDVRPSLAAEDAEAAGRRDRGEAVGDARVCHTRNGAWPPSAGSSNTSWNTSTPPGATMRRPRLVVGQRDVVRRGRRR